MTSPPSVATASRATRTTWLVLLLAAVTAIVTCIAIAGQRIGYPFELEWMEGALVDHAARVAAGDPIYCPPTSEHVPFLYAPLLFWLGGGLIAGGLDGLLALRLVGAASSLGVAMLIGHWVRKETGRVTVGITASGLFLAGYGWLHWWFDLARNDSPFLLSTLGCAYVLRHGGRRRWIAAAILATGAVLAKQSAVMWLPAIGVGALIHDWRNGLRFAIAGVLGILIAVGAMHWSSDGWSTFYLFEMPSHHGWVDEHRLGFWIRDMWPIYPLLVLGSVGFVAGCRSGRVREALFLAAVGGGGLMTSWLSRLHVGGFDNVLMYGFGAACVLGPIAACTRALGRVGHFLPALVLLQFGLLLWQQFTPARLAMALPRPEHAVAHAELQAYIEAQPRDVFLPGHGAITARAGKAPCAHGQAIFDLLQALPKTPDGALDYGALLGVGAGAGGMTDRTRAALHGFRDSMLAAIRDLRYSAIVLDMPDGPPTEPLFALAFGMFGPDLREGTADDLYRRRKAPLLTKPLALMPPIGHQIHSPYALEAIAR
ncbi:MAG: hypothetical protein KDC98_16985 [Planctomycetes bacterium]|nr:hypothetical protein [Planctomycetota bacterium]